MSKVDAQRAMREARYAAMQAQARSPRAASATASTQVSTQVSTDGEGLCGHRGSAGKPCVRPARHPEKSHRYA
jgi:hypothetical protein